MANDFAFNQVDSLFRNVSGVVGDPFQMPFGRKQERAGSARAGLSRFS
jgi:hypothetical protein